MKARLMNTFPMTVAWPWQSTKHNMNLKDLTPRTLGCQIYEGKCAPALKLKSKEKEA